MKRKILFVDDDQRILDGFRTMLHFKRKEWKCRFANNARKGLEFVDKERFDVVIADMRMPGMDGADFLREVEVRQPGTVRMILSGYSEMQALLKSVKHAHQFMSKPCSSETIIETIRRVTELSDILTDESVRTVVAHLDSLPAIPDVYVSISRELESGDPDLKQIGRLVERDAGITATLMKTVNSSFFGFYENILSPVRAVTLLGIEAVKGLVLGVRLLEELDLKKLPGYSVDKLWNHTLQTGYLAKTIASMETSEDLFIESCFIAGMLHDIGKLVFITQMDTLYAPVLDAVRKEGGPIHTFERGGVGVSHAEVGAYLLGLWGFKKEVVQGVYNHHNPQNSGEGLTTSLVVHVANTLQHELGHPETEYVYSPINMECLAAQGLEDRVAEWRDACSNQLEQI